MREQLINQLSIVLSKLEYDDLATLTKKSCEYILTEEPGNGFICNFLVESIHKALEKKCEYKTDEVIAYLFSENVGTEYEKTSFHLSDNALPDTIVTPVGKSFVGRMAKFYLQDHWFSEFVNVDQIVERFPSMVEASEGDCDEEFFYYEFFQYILFMLEEFPEEWNNVIPWTTNRAIDTLSLHGYKLAERSAEDDIFMLLSPESEDKFLVCTESGLVDKAKELEGIK
jgi:hypothetical protein